MTDDAAYETLSGFWYVAKSCTFDVNSAVTNDCFSKFGNVNHPWIRVARFLVFITTAALNNREKREEPTTAIITDKDQIAMQIMKSVSSELGWDRERLDWFAYTDGEKLLSSVEAQEINVNFMLVDREARNQSMRGTGVFESNLLNTTVSDMMEQLQQGEMKVAFQVNGNAAQLRAIEECDTTECRNVSGRVQIPIGSAASQIHESSFKLLSWSLILVSFINFLYRLF